MSGGRVQRAAAAVTGKAGSAYRNLMDHCVDCPACKPQVDLLGRTVGTPEVCPVAAGLRQAWSNACREAR